MKHNVLRTGNMVRKPVMAESLEGTVALVICASGGIGEATARALARQGAAVALVARRTEPIGGWGPSPPLPAASPLDRR